MKHTPPLIIMIIGSFLLAQYIGLVVLDNYISTTVVEGRVRAIEYSDTIIGPPPDIGESTSFIWIVLAVLIGTGLLMFLIRIKQQRMFKYLFLYVVFMTLMTAISSFFPAAARNAFWPFVISAGIAGLAALWRVFRPNVVIHNLTELFIYGGLASFFVPVMNLFSASMLLILISAYDAFAVLKTKHMVKLAEFQLSSKLFAGLNFPYTTKMAKPEQRLEGEEKGKAPTKEVKTAILGGGDIGFTLFFAGAVMKTFGFAMALIIPLFVAAALALLLFFGKKDRFYPAMPFLTAGCFIGLGTVYLMA